MEFIKKKQWSYLAKKSTGELDKQTLWYPNKNQYIMQNVLYCNHCHNMDWFYKYLVLEDGELKLDILNKHTSYNEKSVGDVIEKIANSPEETKSIALFNPKEIVPDDVNYIANLKFKRKNDNPLLVCPNCGKEINNDDIKFLSRAANWITKNCEIYSYGFNRDDDKLILNVFLYSIFPVTDSGKLKYIKINCRFVFNTKTKNVYAMEPYNADTFKPLFKGLKKIMNITHMSTSRQFLTELQRKVITDDNILKYVSEYLSMPNFNETTTFREILLWFRYNKCSAETRAMIDLCCDVDYISQKNKQRRKVIFSEIYKMQDDINFLVSVMKQKKCPMKKKLKKMCINNPFNIYGYRYLTSIGFSDYNIIISILDSEWILFLIKAYMHLLSYDEESNYLKKFLKAYIKNRGEIESKKQLFSEDEYYCGNIHCDCALLYHEIILRIDESDFPLPFTKLYEMHNSMSRLLPKLKMINKKIPYYKKDMLLNKEYGEYSFKLAPDTDSLINCGEAMGICVGGYGNLALNKNCIIVFLIKNNSFKGCIELNPQMQLIQAKAKFNNKIRGKEAYILKQWIEDNNISFENCNDYEHIKNGEVGEFIEELDFNYSITEKIDNPDLINKNIEISNEYLIVEGDIELYKTKDNNQLEIEEDELELLEEEDIEFFDLERLYD